MKKILLILMSCFMVMCFSNSAYSENFYLGGNLGLVLVSDSKLEIEKLETMIDVPVDGELELEFKKGFAFSGVVGYDFGTARLEGEVSYQKNDLDKLTVSFSGISGSANISGDVTSLAFLLNGYYDFHNNSDFTPYVSAGIGMANISVNDFGAPSMGISQSADEDDTVFAYQLGAGLGFAVTEVLTIQLKYRYFSVANPEFDGVEVEVDSHNILAGLRVGF